MLIVRGRVATRFRGPAVAIGNFDGVHRGHQRLFERTRELARAVGGESVVLTFDPHPAKLFAPALAPPLISPLDRKLELIADAGIDACVVATFDHTLAALSPEEFVDQILVGELSARAVCVGYDFTFGKGRAGDTAALATLGKTRNFSVTVIDPVSADGMICSSTKVREFVLEGRVEGAALLLGRDPEIEGEVVRGAGRGRTIQIPTANIRPATELLPAPGVYAGWARIPDGKRYLAAINIGSNPTFGGGALSVEAHLLDYDGKDLYGARLMVGLRRRLRAEVRFSSVEALVAQIRADIAETRKERLA
jgi:riboflavin kinase/FMN adenylyltransferase